MHGEKPMVTIVPTASSIPDEMAKQYVSVFKDLGVENIELFNIRTREDARDSKHLEVIERASGIFFTGGKQLNLTPILGGTKLLQLMRERYTYENILEKYSVPPLVQFILLQLIVQKV